MPATVTLPFEEYQQTRDLNAELSLKVKKLQDELLAAKFEANDGEVRQLHDAVRAALEIVSYAIANLSPEVNKRWPFAALNALAAGVRALPTCSPHDLELASEMEKFARECEVWEVKRKNEPERYVPEPHQPTARAVVDAAALARAADDELARETSSQLDDGV
jgi:hypothetical protein